MVLTVLYGEDQTTDGPWPGKTGGNRDGDGLCSESMV